MPTYPSLTEALREFVLATSTQSQLHIRPVHRYVALRFPYIAASVPSLRRHEWDIDSPALMGLGCPDDLAERLGYRPRLA